MTGNELKKAREQAGLMQKELAYKWGVTRLTILHWEGCGDDPVPKPKIVKILVNDLLNG